MFKLKLLTAAATVALFTAGGAVAETPRSATFSQLDSNNDGLVSRAEWNTWIDSASAGATGADAARQGAQRGYPTSPVGMPRVGGPRTGQAQADRSDDDDTPRAVGSMPSASFSQLDRNRDGRVTRAEWNEHYYGRTAGAAVDPSEAGARGGYPTSAIGEPQVGGPRVSEQAERDADDAPAGASAGAGARRGYPTSPVGRPRVGGSEQSAGSPTR